MLYLFIDPEYVGFEEMSAEHVIGLTDLEDNGILVDMTLEKLWPYCFICDN